MCAPRNACSCAHCPILPSPYKQARGSSQDFRHALTSFSHLLDLQSNMRFTTVFSLFTLAALGLAAPASVDVEDRAAKYHCETKYSGKLSGYHHGMFDLSQSTDVMADGTGSQAKRSRSRGPRLEVRERALILAGRATGKLNGFLSRSILTLALPHLDVFSTSIQQSLLKRRREPRCCHRVRLPQPELLVN